MTVSHHAKRAKTKSGRTVSGNEEMARAGDTMRYDATGWAGSWEQEISRKQIREQELVWYHIIKASRKLIQDRYRCR